MDLIKRRYKEATELAKHETKKNHEMSGGNVFADLGLDDADELFTGAQIG